MQGTEPKHQIDCMNAQDWTVLENLSEDTERHSIIWVVKGRHQNGRIRNIEICVTRRQSQSVVIKGPRHWESEDFRTTAIVQSQIFHSFPVLSQRAIIDIFRILFFDQNERPTIHESADVINVPMCVITDWPGSKPADIAQSQVLL